MDNNKSIYNVIKKSIEDYGQPIAINIHTDSSIDYNKKALVKYKNQAVQSNNMMIELQDEYLFIMLDKIKYDEYIYWNNAYYKVISIDNTIPNIYKVYCKFNNIIEEKVDKYTIILNDISLDVGSTIQLNPIYMKNGIEVKDVTCNYTIADSIIANCGENGLVNGIKEGSTTITINWEGITKTVHVNVKPTAQIDYKIDGIDKFKQKTQATFTINPMVDNSRLEIDPIDIQCDTVKVISQDNGTITLYGNPLYSDTEFTLYAYVGDKKVASKVIIVSKR
ncbi:hypothetical protein [Clostridium weizhouense]|uniref:BIG2 domain-containing protein n=1 Tax=Clostridium weizhouense TaxID=2859781 RepID=A0ABS7AQZ1_9CLOT|nr:hypothetical protein [Clostridium weizhouense]MBW6410974.1 hypothetical protein [Clostridium weizhouense]